MANIRAVEKLAPDVYDRSLIGTVVTVNGELKVNVQGNVIAARWADPVVVSHGDTVLVQLVIGRTGTEAFVKARITSSPRPSRATVTGVPPSSATVSVQGVSDGKTYSAFFVTSYTPVVGDEVMLSWFGSKATIVGKVAATPAPPAVPVSPPAPPIPPPPPPPQTGYSVFAPGQSGTIWPPGGWGSWAGGRGRVYQGNYGSGDVYGAWFYMGSPGQLKGRAITKLQFALGARINAGSYNSPVTVHFYLHNSPTMPGGMLSYVDGPYDVTAWPGQGLAYYDLPAAWGQAMADSGCGIGIKNNPYAGFVGVNEQPDSGKVILDWRK